MATPPFEGHRTFTWFTPRRRAVTEYELYTVGQQSNPGQWLHVGWPIRFDDGREPYTASSTAIRCGNWHDYRDPAGLWQRPYVAAANHTEQALARLIPAELSAGPDGMALTEEGFLAGDAAGTFVTEVAEITRLTRDVRGLRLRLLDPGSIRFTAGQFVTVEVPGTAATRAFSMASPPSESGSIDLVVRVLPGGAFSAALDERLAPGDRLRVSGPFGQLKVRLSHRPIIMIAGGSGLAPIESMAADLADRRNTRPVTVFFGVRTAADLFHLERLEAIRGRMPGLEIVPVLSEPGPGWAGETGLVTDAVDRRLPRLSGYDAYLCGPPAMIDAAVELVTRRGVRPRNVYFDAFVPTG